MSLDPLREQVLALPAGNFWLAITFVSALGCVALVAGLGWLRRKLVIAGTPTSRIRSAAQGYVELEGYGELMDGEPIQAPLSGTPCTWYSYKVEQKRGRYWRGGSESRWQVIERGSSDALFWLVDDTGRCIVDPSGATVTHSAQQTWYGDSPRPRRGSVHKWSFTRRFRYHEERLLPGDPLYAIGLFSTAGGAGAALPAEAEIRDLIRLWKADQETLLQRFDRDRDGAIDVDEWQAVRAAAEAEVTERSPGAQPAAVEVLGATKDPSRPFLLAAAPQEDLVRQLHWQAIGALSFALIAAASIFWAISIRA